MAGLALGLALAPVQSLRGESISLAVIALGALGLAIARPRAGEGEGGSSLGSVSWLGLVVCVAVGGGLVLGTARLAALDRTAVTGPVEGRLSAAGFVMAPPRSADGELRVEVETPQGRILIRAPDLGRELGVGEKVTARGRIVQPEPWLAPWLRRRGIAVILESNEIEPSGSVRGGLAGGIDAIRRGAERALERGMPEREAALARGFVLGQDDRIDPRTREDFKRSGLAHLLAVSGQNVLLLCMLAWPLLALLGVTLRARLIALLLLVAVYVPVTGAGPSIQRAGVMGAAGLIAALADRPASRWYALSLAAAITLGLNPRAAGDVGWQLSFAAVLGILLWTRRLADLACGDARGSPRRAVAEGLAMTAAATVATAPLMGHHFDAFPLAALPANLLALPAVAPAMWLGMLAGMAGQLPALPVEPLNWLNSICLAYISQVARWLAAPSWALLELPLESPFALAAAYGAVFGVVELTLRWGKRRGGLRPRALHGPVLRRGAFAAFALVASLGLAFALRGAPGEEAGSRPGSLRVVFFDVGQGDSVMLDPPRGEPILVDTGPPGSGVAERLRELGVGSLRALVVTHDQSDHSGSLSALASAVRIRSLALAIPGPRLPSMARGAGAELVRLAEGGELRSGELRLTALWPPAELLDAPAGAPSEASSGARAGDELNRLSVVLLAEWRHFSLLLTGDAEAEVAPLDPGPVDVLKVAHHGSEDGGLDRLLARTVPDLAVISVGAGNPFGHPAPATLEELGEAAVPVARTDRDGEITLEANAEAWRVRG